MKIGLLEMVLSMPGNRSLKDKRMVLKSIKDQLHNKFNVSVAEVDLHDKWCIAALAAVVVSRETSHAHKVLDSVVGYIQRRPEVVLADFSIEML
jgi:uncharacterized protein YlxP (DUF503 family)